MREWRSYWRGKPKLETADFEASLRQVGKTTLGKPVGQEQIQLMVDRISAALALRHDDKVADLGCGNGLLTVRVAKLIKEIQGVDVSPSLIESAREFHCSRNCSYLVNDIADGSCIRHLPPDTRKFYSYEVLQHLSTEELSRLLTALSQSRPQGFFFFVASVPDQSKLHAFYDTPERYAFYERNVASGQEQIGHWWEQDELQGECSRLGLSCKFMEQDRRLYTAHYRFDALITSRV